jgi:asparagine synthetase B (glutamine-hydrolysing)
MCGIVGVLNLHEPQPIPEQVLPQMLGMIRHRGPDEFGIYRDEWVNLGNARLSIIDLSGGQQPICNEDGTLWIVFNGEIFNYVELRPELEALGHRFTTHCDTEVILHLYEEYGSDCLNYLNGQFAIAIWDTRKRSLFLARDRLGIRPLFYTVRDGQLVFGSEIKTLLAHPNVHAQIDPAALAQVFTFWSVLAPQTIFQDVRTLPPAHYMVVRDGQINIQPYWELDFTVVITGEGADEFLGGYDIFKEMAIRRFWAKQPDSQQRPLLLKRLYPEISRLGSSSEAFLTAFFKKNLTDTESPFYSHLIRWSNTSRLQRLLLSGPEVPIPQWAEQLVPLPSKFQNWSPLAQAQYLEIVTFMSPYLLSSQGDRVAMANSVEGRFPFLDYRVVEFCNRLPSNVKLRGLNEKWLLRQLASKLLPADIWQRRKRPYSAPIHRSFFHQETPDYVSELLSEDALRESGLFNPLAVNQLVRKAQSGAQYKAFRSFSRRIHRLNSISWKILTNRKCILLVLFIFRLVRIPSRNPK